MNDKINFKTIVVIALLICSIFIAYYIKSNLLNRDSNKEYTYLKNYKVNEYIPVYISDEEMAKIYLNDYINNMYYNIDKAYNSLDEQYRNKKFGNLQEYKNYVKSLDNKSYRVSTYYKYDEGGYTIFGVTDQNSNLYIFKTNGVMQYSVYLDDYTVEI